MSGCKNSPWHNTFARRLKVAREAQGLTQLQLEKKAGLSACKISLYERGDARPTLEHFRAIVVALDIPAGHLLSTE